MGWDTLREILYGLVPTAGVVLIFYVVIRAILRADEAERQAARQFGEPTAGGPPDEAAGDAAGNRAPKPDGDGEQDSPGTGKTTE